jgi:hypothetical protein
MIDIMEITTDIGVLNSSIKKAENVLSVQLGKLEYAQEFGIDLEYFLDENFKFQNESFKSYLLQRLSESSIDVMSIIDTAESLYNNMVFNLTPENQTSAMVR